MKVRLFEAMMNHMQMSRGMVMPLLDTGVLNRGQASKLHGLRAIAVQKSEVE